MPTRVLAFVLFLGLQLFPISPSTAQSFNGHWQGLSEGEVGKMTFDKKGYVTFIINDQPMGGKKFTSEGIDMTMRYEYDDHVTPHTIDFVLSMAGDGTELTRMLGIYQFVNAKTLIINMDFEGKARPTVFDPEDKNQIQLSKIK